MTRYGMVIDETLCNGCYSCFLACRDEFCGNDYPDYSAARPMAGMNWLRVIEKERGRYPKVKVAWTSVLCMHCDDPPCVRLSPAGTVYKRPDGIVIIDPLKAVGMKQIVTTCPYRVIEWNNEKQLPQKCTFCAHMLDKGEKVTRCSEACPTGAIAFGDLDDPESEVSKRMATGLTELFHPEFDLRGRVTYIGLPKRFIAGSVLFGDTGKCAENLKVKISSCNETRTTLTNNYGDFEIDDLKANTEYIVKIDYTGYKSKRMKVRTRLDVYLGDISLNLINDK